MFVFFVFKDAAQSLRQANSDFAQATGYFHDMGNNALSILAHDQSRQLQRTQAAPTKVV